MKSATAAANAAPEQAVRYARDRDQFEKLLQKCVRSMGLDPAGDVLVVGGSANDGRTLRRVGFTRVTLSNLLDPRPSDQSDLEAAGMRAVRVDAEAMALPDNSYDLVLAHAMLHHCRSPHKALLEMLRVSRRHLVLLEPNNSLAMRALLKLRFSFPYELPAVVANGFRNGGVRDGCVPNYVYRWNAVDLHQTTASYLAEYEFDLYAKAYWEFNIDETELRRRSETRIGKVTSIVSPKLFLAGLHGFQAVANHIPWLGSQGNKFFACIQKRSELKPWLMRIGNEIQFDARYIARQHAR